MSNEPNLFIIGAMKSGTSSLHNYLSSHPDIFMSQVKEPMHFSREDMWSKGNDDYLGLFADAKNEKYMGESSTEYTKLPFRDGVAKRLYEFNPEAKLIYILRDPFKRIVSQYKHQVRAGSAKTALLDEMRKPNDYLTNSYYAYQLQPYIELFGRDAIYIGSFEDLIANPKAFCQDVFQWLKVDATFTPANLSEIKNASPVTISVDNGPSAIRNMAKKIAQVQFIKKLTPKFVRSYVKKASNMIEFDFSSEKFKDEMMQAKVAVFPILKKWNDELEVLTGKRFNQWETNTSDINQQQNVSKVTDELEAIIKSVTARK